MGPVAGGQRSVVSVVSSHRSISVLGRKSQLLRSHKTGSYVSVKLKSNRPKQCCFWLHEESALSCRDHTHWEIWLCTNLACHCDRRLSYGHCYQCYRPYEWVSEQTNERN